jgi:pimeloyl-ACP methyl ester carboxylesterase
MAVAVGTLALTALAGLAAQEQAGSTKPVAFATADGVKLKGTLYPGGKAGSTVVMLHAVGEDSSKKEYQNLAKKLQTAGYSVLTFDFRGHGQSTTVEPGMPNFNPKLSIPGFWDEIENQRGVRGYNAKKRPTEIDQKQFTPAYHRILVNDIAAAVNHLEESGEASNLVLLGAGDGATLGALWLNSEWHRYKLLPPQPPKFRTPRPDLQNPEGQRVRAAVWLSISDKLGSQNVSVSGLLDVAARQKQTPMIFFYADGDEKGKKIALAAEKALKTDKKNQEFLIAYKIKDAEKLTGRNLLVDSLGTDRLILSYLKNALEGRLNQAKASSGKSEDAPYIWQWQTRTGQVMQRPARQRGANFILFSTYDVFLR